LYAISLDKLLLARVCEHCPLLLLRLYYMNGRAILEPDELYDNDPQLIRVVFLARAFGIPWQVACILDICALVFLIARSSRKQLFCNLWQDCGLIVRTVYTIVYQTHL
jgi:hypothetical protein